MTDDQLKKILASKKQKSGVSKKGKPFVIAGFVTSTFEEFKNWFRLEEFERGCHYCGTTNQRSFELYQQRYHATRGGKRGMRLELDRKDPTKSYDDLENLVWCCYWCNNAKTNFFSEEEFKPIGVAIGKALNDLK